MQHSYYNYYNYIVMYVKSTFIKTKQLLSQWQKYQEHVQIMEHHFAVTTNTLYSIDDIQLVFKQ